MTEESRLREIHHSLSCFTPQLFTSTMIKTGQWMEGKHEWRNFTNITKVHQTLSLSKVRVNKQI